LPGSWEGLPFAGAAFVDEGDTFIVCNLTFFAWKGLPFTGTAFAVEGDFQIFIAFNLKKREKIR